MQVSADVGFQCVGVSPGFQDVLHIAETIAPRKSTIVLCGESGTGKEMIAHQIHQWSRRRQHAFIPVDCTNLCGELFTSQLFGHVKGAFTGADRDTLGFFRAADGGTLFLDEIGELSSGVQSKLLRVLQESTVTPVGATHSYPIDVRIICATNRNIEEMISDGTFRSDLYYRINVVTVHIPPLRQRRGDIIALAEYFLVQQANLYDEPLKRLSSQAKDMLIRYSWPGNVRELANAMEHAYVLTVGQTIEISALPSYIHVDNSVMPAESFQTLDQVNCIYIKRALEYTKGSKSATARLLGLERRRLNRLIDRLHVTMG